MSYKIPKQPPRRDPDLEWEEAAPGLYDDGEVLVQLGDIHAAVSVRHEWLENGAGVTFFGTARWCDKSGQTHLCPVGNHVESHISVTVGPVTMSEHSFEEIKKEVLLALLGEDPQLKKDDGEGNLVDVISLGHSVKLSANIRHAAKTVSAMRESADPMTLLS